MRAPVMVSPLVVPARAGMVRCLLAWARRMLVLAGLNSSFVARDEREWVEWCGRAESVPAGRGLEEELVGFAGGADGGEGLGEGADDAFRQLAGALGADADAAHAGDAEGAVGAEGVGVDGAGRAVRGAVAAVVAGVVGEGDEVDAAEGFVGALAGEVWGAGVAAVVFFQDALSVLLQLLPVCCVGTAGAVAVDDGVLGGGGDGGDDVQAAPGGEVGEFDEGVFVRAVAVGAEQDAGGAVAVECGDALRGEGGDAPAVAGDGEQDEVAGGGGEVAAVGVGPGEVGVVQGGAGCPGAGEGVGCALGAAGGAENQLIHHLHYLLYV